ncbi:MAG: flippase-like domain-containing protein [Acidithiobacillus sp.]|nr:flippase-like domain-containing protein [Acidithiobacillus sp.]
MNLNIRFWLILVLAIAISFVPIIALINGRALHLLTHIQLPLLFGLVILMLISWFFEANRLRWICAAVGLRLSLRGALPLVMAAEFAGAATPAASGMGAAYLAFLYRRGLNFGTATAVLIAIAITDILFMVSIFLLSLFYLLIFDNFVPNVRTILWLVGFVTITSLLLLVLWTFERNTIVHGLDRLLLHWSWYRRYRKRVALFFLRLLKTLEILRKTSWRQRGMILLAAAGYWTPRYLVLWVLMEYLGGRVSVPYIVVSQTLLNLTSQLSFLPGGAGSVGAAYSLLFGGTLPQADVAFSLLGWRLFTYYWYLLIGMPWFFWEWGEGHRGPPTRSVEQ